MVPVSRICFADAVVQIGVVPVGTIAGSRMRSAATSSGTGGATRRSRGRRCREELGWPLPRMDSAASRVAGNAIS